MAYTSNGVPYVEPTDAVSDYPNTSLELANYIDNSKPTYIGDYQHNFGTVNAGDSGHNLTAFAFNGEVGDIWTANFIMDAGGVPGVPNGSGGSDIRLSTAAGTGLYHPTSNLTFEIGSLSAPASATYTWKARAASDYLIVNFIGNAYGLTNVQIVANGVMNLGGI